MRLLISCLLIAGSISTMADLYETVEHKYAKHYDVSIHYVVTGPEEGPLVVMIHGFPDFWYTWRVSNGSFAV